MDPNYRATDEHWRLIENWPSLCSEYTQSRCILELRARVAALEAAQQLAGTDHAGWHRLSDVKPLNGAQCLFQVHPNLLHSRGVWVDQSHSLTPSISPSGFYTDRGLFVGDPALIWWSAIEPEAQQPAPATEESLTTAPPAPAGVQRRYPSPATIAECGGPCDSEGPWACDCGLLDALNPPMPTPAAHDATNAAPLLWLLWNHQGSSSPVGQPIRKYLGMGQFQRMSKEQVEAAKSWGSIPFPAQPAPPAPAAELVERVAEAMERHRVTGDIEGSWDAQARAVVREVASWLRSDGPDWPSVASLLEQEADR